jgi:DNA-binding XRE family transcriptional regulator
MPQVRAPGVRQPESPQEALQATPAARLPCGSLACRRDSILSRHRLRRQCSMHGRKYLPTPSTRRPEVSSAVPYETARQALVVVALRLTSMIRGRTIRKLRQSAGMTQAEMAALLRMPSLTLTRWEAGSLDLKAKILHGLLAARAKIKEGDAVSWPRPGPRSAASGHRQRGT